MEEAEAANNGLKMGKLLRSFLRSSSPPLEPALIRCDVALMVFLAFNLSSPPLTSD